MISRLTFLHTHPGAKPNSPFGVLHNSDSLEKERAKQYPALNNDIVKERGKGGIVAYLFNTLIDGESENKNASPTGKAAGSPSGHNHDEESRGSEEGGSGRGQVVSETEGSTEVPSNKVQ